MATKVFDLETAEALISGTATFTCPKCGESRWMKAQPAHQTKKRGMLTVRCMACHSKANAAYNNERYASDEEFREFRKAYNNDRCANNEEHREAKNAKSLAWKRANRGAANAALARYRAAKRQATPPWSETALIKEFYMKCKPGYHVDHIYPLVSPLDDNGKEIGCGLHVLANLQYLPASENISKSNKWPEL